MFVGNYITNMDFEALKKHRKARKITQEQLANHLGISRELVSRYEKGLSSPKLTTFESWCEFIGVEIKILTSLPIIK